MDEELWNVPPVTFSFPVEWGKCREFALALLDEDPARPQTAGGSSPAVLPMPPIMATCAFRYSPDNMPPSARLVERGLVDRARMLQGGLEFEFHRPMQSGETLTVTDRLDRVHDKQTSKGTLRFLEFETLFRSADGEPVCTIRTTNIERGA
jgi:hypothetical protein